MSYYFQYFPGNYMWSRAILKAIELARWGAGAIGEADQIGQRLKDHQGDNEAWYEEWTAMAEKIEGFADAEAVAGHQLAAGSYYLRAATYHFLGERFLAPGPRKIDSYRRFLHCFDRGAQRRYPNIERVTVPYGNTTLPARFMKAPGASARAPTVVLFDGLDDTKELLILFGGVELANRGIHTLAIDGPGQGEALRLQAIPSRYDYEVPAAAAYDYVAGRPDVDPSRVAIMAYSMGGYYAPRAAAFEKRFSACVAWSGHYDYHAVWVERRRVLESGGTKASVPQFHLPWILGVSDMDAAMEKLKQYTLADVAPRIQCPLLVVHGENDDIVPVEYARRLYETAGSKTKTLKIFSAAEGGSGHGQGDNLQIGSDYVADWVAEHI